MKKSSLFLFISLVFILLLISCDPDEPSDSKTDDAPVIHVNGSRQTDVSAWVQEDLSFNDNSCSGSSCQDPADWEINYADTADWVNFQTGNSDEFTTRFWPVGKHTIRATNSAGTDTISITIKGNNYPVVLIGGFTMWGRDEVNLQLTPSYSVALQYWGLGSGDVETYMNDLGYDVYTASVGPLTSVWDRACELYAQLTGTNVDYGSFHSAMFTGGGYTHAQTGNDRPSSGTKLLVNTKGRTINNGNPISSSYPVHLIGHSMGGITARMLAHFLAQGSPNCTDQAPGQKTCEGDSPLFKGGNNGNLRSVTAITSPHNGTGIANFFQDALSASELLGVPLIEMLTGNDEGFASLSLADVYDIDCDQWTPINAPFSSSTTYDPANCQNEPPMKDFLMWDASKCGADELNEFLTAETDIYYFSWATEQSFKCEDSIVCTPRDWYYEDSLDPLRMLWNKSEDHGGQMSPLFRPRADELGSSEWTDGYGMTAEWRENDGVVNTLSAIKPSIDDFTSNCSTNSPNLTVALEPGKWQYMDKLHVDHYDVCGGILELKFYNEIWGVNTPQGTDYMDWFDKYLLFKLHQLPEFDEE